MGAKGLLEEQDALQGGRTEGFFGLDGEHKFGHEKAPSVRTGLGLRVDGFSKRGA